MKARLLGYVSFMNTEDEPPDMTIGKVYEFSTPYYKSIGVQIHNILDDAGMGRSSDVFNWEYIDEG